MDTKESLYNYENNINEKIETVQYSELDEIEGENMTSNEVPKRPELNESNPESSEWMDILGTGGLKKKILKHGIVESRPVSGNVVRINATGSLENGQEVDRFSDTVFTLGGGEVISGLEMAVELMDKGEVCEVFMESRFAYGKIGLLPKIPTDVHITYVIELVDYWPEKEPEALTPRDRLDIGVRKRERGNWWFKREEFSQAIRCYKAAVDYLDDTSDTYGEVLSAELREILEERLKTLNNMAAAQMRLEAFDVALMSVEALLKCQPDNVKALYRKGKILSEQGEWKKGLEVLSKALSLEPDSKLLQTEAAKLREKIRKEAESEKSLYRRMLGLKTEDATPKYNDPHPTLRARPFVVWGISFVALLVILFAFSHLKQLYEFS